jgi:hypothetical protein
MPGAFHRTGHFLCADVTLDLVVHLMENDR